MNMKKNILTSLLSLIAVFSVCESALGEIIKITPRGTSGENGFISFYTSKGNGFQDPYYNANEDLRIYANGTITITSMYTYGMRSIVFNISSQGRTRLASITASSGTISKQTSGATTVTWTGNARQVTLTVGDKADYGSGDHSKAGQLCFTDFVVELDGNTRVEGDIIMFADNFVRNECLAKWDKNDDDRLSLNEAAAVENLGSFCNTLTYSYFTSFDELRFFTGLTSIDANAFLGCKRLTSITIPENVTSIEFGAFEGCSSLTSITIPKNVTDIERNAFLSCSGLQDVYIYAIDVPTTGKNLFDEDIYRNSTLHVPTFSLNAYRATEPWSKFGKIVANDDYDTPNVTGKTFRLSCARGYVGYNGSTLCGTSQEAASKFAIVDYGNTNSLYDVTNKAFVIHTTAAKAGSTGNLILESSTVLSKAVTGLTWGKTYINDYPYYLEDYFGNWLNMDGNLNVLMNTWQDFEDGDSGNTYQVEIVNTNFNATEAIQMLDSYFNRNVISDLSELSNMMQYIIHTKDDVRGALGVANSELASTNPTAQGHKCKKATPFAILQYDGNYFLYSTADQKFITGTGGETDTPQPDDAWTLVKNENGYFMFKVASTGKVLNVNNSPGIQINTWGTAETQWDDGNQFIIEEAGDFDPTDALAMFVVDNTPNVTGKTFTLRCARGYVGYDGSALYGTTSQETASEFAIVNYGTTNYLYDVTHKAFVIHSTAAMAGDMGNRSLESSTYFAAAVTGLSWGKTGIATYPWYLEDSFTNWLNMGGKKDVNMNTWKDFEGGSGGNTYRVEIVNEHFDVTEAIQMLDRYFHPISISSITLNKTSEILKAIGKTVQLTPTIEPNNATNKNVVWSSSNTAVATVSETGLVNAVGSGTATITATAADGSGVTASCEVTVKIPVTSITLDTTSEVLTAMGQTIQLTPTVLPDNATDKTVTWSSSNPAVATVSDTGLVTAVGDGTATITATAADGSGVTATCEVTVITPMEATFNGSNAKLSASWFANGSMEPRSGLQEMHAVHYQPGNTDRSGDGTSVTDNKVFVFNLLSGFKGGAINAETTDTRGMSTALTIVFDTQKYKRGIIQTGLSGKDYTMTATNDVVSATYDGETKEVVRLMDSYKTKEGRWIEFQNNDFAKDLLNAAPIFNADGKTTDAFYTEMTLASKENILMNLSGDTDFRVRYLRPIDITHVHKHKAYLKDAAEAGYDIMYMAHLFNFTEWRQYPFGYSVTDNVSERQTWINFYGIHDIYFNLDEIESDMDGIVEKLDNPNLSLTIERPAENKRDYSTLAKYRTSIGYVRYQNNGGAVGSYNLFIPFHIVHNWGEVVLRVQVPIVGTFDDETNIRWLDEEVVLATSVELDKTEMNLAIGHKQQLTATVKPTDATNHNVTWRSTDVTVVTVDDDGLVTAVGNGKAQIIATTADGSNKTASCLVMVSLPGDVNGDGKVNGADIVAVSNYVLNNSTDKRGDVNNDGKVNGADIVAVINYVLNFIGVKAAQPWLLQTLSDEAAEMSASCTHEGIALDLAGGTAFTAFQMMLSLPEGVSLNSVQGNRERLDKHELLFQHQPDGRYLVLGYAADNRCIEGTTGRLLSLLTDKKVNGTAVLSDILLFTPQATTKQLPALSIDLATGVEEIEYGQMDMTHDGHIYDLGGRLVLSSSDYERHPEILRTGIYVRNGRKFIVK